MLHAAEIVTRFHTLARRLHRAEDGIALVVAVGFTAVLGITATSAIAYSTTNERSAQVQKADQLALSYAEAALARAYSSVYGAADPRDPNAVPEQTVTFERGTGTYSGTLTAENRWELVGVGRVPSPANGSDIVRTVRGRTSVGSGTRGSANNAVWNYVYVDNTTSCTTLSNTVTINVPLYVRGDLCLRNSAAVTASAYTLQVGGTVQFENTDTTIGTAAAPLREVHIGGGCRVGTSGAFTKPCSAATRVHSEIADDSSPTGLTKPPLDLARWYAEAKPGPLHGCTVGSFPGGFDTDTTLNHSRGTVDLAPDTPYDCQYWENGRLVGQIKWVPGSPGTLTILGTVFFDGDIVFRNRTNAVYVGRGTVYSSGRIQLSNETRLCGTAACDETWRPLENLLAFVAGGMDGGSTSFDASNYSRFQGAVYAARDYREGNDSEVWGPIIADRIFLANSSRNFYVPIGTLLSGMPAQYEEVVVLSNEPGSWG